MEEPVLPAAIVPAARVHSCVHACTRVCMHAQLYTPAHASNRLRICRRHGRQSAHGACGHACAHNCGHAMCVLARAMVVCRLTMSRRSRRTCPCHGACRPGRGDAQRGVRTCMPCGRVGLEARQVPPAARPGTSRHVTSRHVTSRHGKQPGAESQSRSSQSRSPRAGSHKARSGSGGLGWGMLACPLSPHLGRQEQVCTPRGAESAGACALSEPLWRRASAARSPSCANRALCGCGRSGGRSGS